MAEWKTQKLQFKDNGKIVYKDDEAEYIELHPFNMKMYLMTGEKARNAAAAHSMDKSYLDVEGGGASQDFEDGWVIMWLFGTDMNTIAHEIGHIIRFVEDRVGLEKKGSYEAQCYLTGWLTTEVLNKLKASGVRVKI